MKKAFLTLSATVLLASPFAFIHAQTPVMQNQNRLEAQERREERREALEQKREEIQNRFEEKRMLLQGQAWQKVSDILERVMGRTQDAIDRVEGFADRIDARLDILEDDGLDVDASREHVEKARTSLDDAQDALNAVDPSEIIDDIGTSTPAAPMATLRAELLKVKELIREAHMHLVDAITSIKAGLQKDDTEAEDEDDAQ